MKRRTLPTATALAAAAALLLTACGSDNDNSKASNKTGQADAGRSASASPSAPASPAADRPRIELPAGDTLTFSPEHAGDPVKNAVLRDNAELIRAIDAAIGAQNPRLRALEYYTKGEGAATAQQWVQSFKDAGLTVTGTAPRCDPAAVMVIVSC